MSDNETLSGALREEIAWHESEDKALSKSGRTDADYYWHRDQHKQRIAALEAALAAQPDAAAPTPAAVGQGEAVWPWLGALGELVSAAGDRDLSAHDHARAVSQAHSKLFDILRATHPAAVREVDEAWQPIGSAPDEGQHIRGLWVTTRRVGYPDSRDWRSFIGRMDDRGRFVDPEYGEDFGWEAGDYDCWMPLPKPPAALARDGVEGGALE